MISSLICYELPSKQTLGGFLKMNNHEITEETVYYILNDLVEAIDYLSSRQIAHHAILPENIILVESTQVRTMVYFIFIASNDFYCSILLDRSRNL